MQAVRLISTNIGMLPEHVVARPGGDIVLHPSARSAASVPPPAPVRRAWLGRVNAIGETALPSLLLLVLLIAAWEVACGTEGSALPSPSRIWSESHDVILHPLKGVALDLSGLHIDETGDVGIAGHVLTSLSRVGLGFGLAAFAGIALGVLIGQSKTAYRALDPFFQVLRTIPPLAWLPISLAVFQQAGPSTIFLIFITSIWPVILNTATGVQTIPTTYRNVARVLGLNPFEYFLRIMLPATVPHMFTGLRIGVGMSWLAIVAAEMVQGGTGIGFFIWDSYNSSLLTDTIVALVWIGLVGFALDRLVAYVGRRVARQSDGRK